MSTELREDTLVSDTIYYLPVAAIDPDPEQPRLAVDAELADSIAQHGVLQPIQVRPHPEDADRWTIVDGERRWKGATAAKLKTIPAQITLDVEDVGDRLVRQIVRNEGKPLTPVEEAKAFKRIIDQRRAAGHKNYGVVQLATELGIAKSTVSDRLALTDIPAFWLDLMVTGPLQPSHAPLLRRWAKVPEKYQLKALEQMKADYRWPGAVGFSKGKKGERIYGEVLETLLRTFMTKFIKPVSEVPGYEGPTERGDFGDYGGARTYAMDPSKWQPIHRKKSAEKRSKTVADVKSGKKEPATPRWVTAAIDAGAKLGHGEFRSWDHKRGETKIADQEGGRSFTWWYGFHQESKIFDPEVFLRELDITRLGIYEHSGYGGKSFTLVTTDNAALGQARSSYLSARAAEYARINGNVAEQLVLDPLQVDGSGAPAVLALLAENQLDEDLYDLCAALGIADVLEVKDRRKLPKIFRAMAPATAGRLLSAVATAAVRGIPSAGAQLEAWEKAQLEAFAKVKPAFGVAADGQVENDAPDPAAKPTPRRRKNAVDEEALNAEATGEIDVDDEMLGLVLTCRGCGCTEGHACETDEGPCTWISEAPAFCSAPECVEQFKQEFPTEAADLGLLEPAHAGAED